uniref:Peptidase C1A papain C-terminal domain-containing protein n=1 Tax=Alexandrium catenella TaxID=2925 RepID=A0A7S1RV81_ALECA
MAPRVLALALVVCPAAALRTAAIGAKVADLKSYTFRRFVEDFQRTYEQGTEQWAMREALFNERILAMAEHNSADRSWKMDISKFMDYTEVEKQRQLGYTGGRSRKQESGGSESVALKRSSSLPSTFSVASEKAPRTKLLTIIRDQGNCGSCWAEAATSTFEGQLEVNSTLMEELEASMKIDKRMPQTPTLSSQTVVSCTENKRHCGGTGGCGGATVELAYDMVMEHGGLPFATSWSYTGSDATCRKDVFNDHKISMAGYTILPSNKLNPLVEALVGSGGPIAVSVDATNWFTYGRGVYTDRYNPDFTVNHAVTLMGYKMPEGQTPGWYDIKNSWGSFWGENGHIRIEMKPEEEKHCGYDRKTHDGIACDGDPDTAWVCGTCGVLYDSVFPYGLTIEKVSR